MYNMDINILGYKVSLEVLILIGVIYIILVSHTVCGCCNMYRIMEGLENMTKKDPTKKEQDKTNTDSKMKEGFVGANTNNGLSAPYSQTSFTPIDTKNWGRPDLVVKPGQPLPEGVKQILNRDPQPIPLPEGEMLMFANTPFKPECCPTTFSNSSGCACMTTDQYNYLIERGGNNVPYSEY